MPYRRLPNTDRARVRAMKNACEMGKITSPVDLAFSQATLQKVKYFLPLLEQTMIQQNQAFSNQIESSKEYNDLLKKAKLYVSHFIQVLNMAVLRGEIPAKLKAYYKLSESSKKTPVLNTENQLIKWGERIINGESLRLSEGGNPITNPTIALVKVRYEKFLHAYRKQKSLQEINNRALNKVADLRTESDRIILKIWNEVEDHFSGYPSDQRRAKCSAYGIVYVYRKGEKMRNVAESDKDEEEQTMTIQEARMADGKNELQYAFGFSEDKINQPAGQH